MRFGMAAACCIGFISTAALAQQAYQLRPYSETVKPNQLRPKVMPMAPAPPLTSVSVYAVGSTQAGGWEGTSGKSTTTLDHGGTQLRVAVVEWGYSSSSVARFNGSILPSSANYTSDTICGGSPSAPQGCNPGQTIVGWIEYYNLDGRGSSGTFQYQATSISAPARTYSTSINIR